MKVHYLEQLPSGFFDVKLEKLDSVFDGPTIITLKGRDDSKKLFLSTLLHGSETTGFLTLQRFLKDHVDNLPITLILFIGNIPAAVKGVRHLEEQEDFNRIWDSGMSPACQMAKEVIRFAINENVTASIDIHNNTGKNPYYGCVNCIDKASLDFASHFDSTIIYFTEPHEVFSNAFTKFCPSLTLECGLPGLEDGINYLYEFLNRIIFEYDWNNPKAAGEYKIYHSFARIKLPLKCSLDFNFDKDGPSDYSFLDDFDELNFKVIEPGRVLGYYKEEAQPLCILDSHNRIVTNDFFDFVDYQIITKAQMIPSMFTKLASVAKSDSLGYIMVSYKG